MQFSIYMIAIYRLSSYIGSMIATHGSHDLKSKLCFFTSGCRFGKVGVLWLHLCPCRKLLDIKWTEEESVLASLMA